MTLVNGSDRIVETENCDPLAGEVRWRPVRSLWIGGMTSIAVSISRVRRAL